MAERNGTVADFNRPIVDEFRANGGKVGGMFEGMTLALVTTIGAKTGLARTSPLGYQEIDGRVVIVASAAGAPTDPAWYHNLRANPRATVEVGTDTYEAVAEILEGEERDRIFEKIVAVAPGFADYQKKTTRVIPVVVLRRATDA